MEYSPTNTEHMDITAAAYANCFALRAATAAYMAAKEQLVQQQTAESAEQETQHGTI